MDNGTATVTPFSQQTFESLVDPNVKAEAAARLEAVEAWIVFYRKYYRTLTLILRKVWVCDAMPNTPRRMAVDYKGRLYVNADWLAGTSDEFAVTAFIHELHHILRLHDKRGKGKENIKIEYPIEDDELARYSLFNVCADFEINVELRDDPDLFFDQSNPEMSLAFPEMFDLPKGEIAEVYYKILLDRLKTEPLKPPQSPGDQGKEGEGEGDQDDETSADDDGSNGEENDGSEDGDDTGDGSEDGDDTGDGSEDGDDTGDGSPNNASGGSGGDRTGAGSCVIDGSDENSDAGKAALEQGQKPMSPGEMAAHLRRAAEEIQKSRGTVPAGLLRWAEEYLEPVFNWTNEFRRLYRFSRKAARGRSEVTFKRPNRRFPPKAGQVILPTYQTRLPNISVLVDTSGSMSVGDLTAAVSEIGGILAASGNGDEGIDLWACDAEVHGPYAVKAIKDIKLRGGGGTDMRPGIAKIMATTDPDIIVCLTDGYTPWPTDDELKTQLIIVIIGTVINPIVTQNIPAKAKAIFIPTVAFGGRQN